MKKFMVVLFAALFVLSLNSVVAQTQDLIPIVVGVSAQALAVSPGDLTFEELNANTCYQAPADPAGLNTIAPYTGAEAVTQTASTITGDPFVPVDVTFTLPTFLAGTGGYAGVVTLGYDNLSAAWGEDGAQTYFFNPQGTTTTVELNASGECYVLLSANPCTPRTFDADSFEGFAVITVQYH